MKAVLDASVIVRAVVPDQSEHQAVRDWLPTVTDIVAPALIFFEVVTAIRSLEAHQQIDATAADTALSAALAVRVTARMSADLHRRAYSLARELVVSRAADTAYLAVALAEGCPLFTLDERFWRNCSSRGYHVCHPIKSGR